MEQELFQVGSVVGMHGLRGDLKVRPATRGSTSLAEAKRVWLRKKGQQPVLYRPLRATPHKGNLLLRLSGLESIEIAEPLVGCDVLMARDDLPPLEQDEHYWFEIEGCTVVDSRLGEIGILRDLLTTAAHDLYVVEGPYGEVLIPVVAEMVTAIEPRQRLIRVDLPPGLVEVGEER